MSTGLADKRRDGEESWISVSDLMAGLMMVFLFLAVIYAMDAKQKSQNVTEIVTDLRDTELKIHRALVDEFEDDLPRWNAEIDKESLTIRFLSPLTAWIRPPPSSPAAGATERFRSATPKCGATHRLEQGVGQTDATNAS